MEKNIREEEIKEMIDTLLSKPGILFQNTQLGERDLEPEEKRKIAENLLKQGGALPFLKRFGRYLNEKHLDIFRPEREDEELCFVLEKLKMANSPSNPKMRIKNRRYGALSRMKKDSSYFSEVEMMRRNPLLYEQLVGRYLSEDERKIRDNIDTQNITLLNVLLEGIDREQTRNLLEENREQEIQMEEDADDEDLLADRSESDSDDDDIQFQNTRARWGEMDVENDERPRIVPKKRPKKIEQILITAPERTLLRDEFFQEMCRSFLAGEDKDFDYSVIDNDSTYDCMEIIEQDEEDEYFDSETPEEGKTDRVKDTIDESSEDELDAYMDALSKHPALKNITQCE